MKKEWTIRRVLMYAALSIAAASFIYPFIWMIGASFAPMHQVGNMNLFPADPTIGNYISMFEKIPIGRSLFNSLFVALASTALVLFTGSTVGYALAKMNFRGKGMIFFVIVFTMSLPFQVTLIPNYITMVNFRWVD